MNDDKTTHAVFESSMSDQLKLQSVLPTFRFKLTDCAAKLQLGYVMFPFYVVRRSSLSLWSIGCKIDIFCKWLPQRHSNLWQHQQRVFFLRYTTEEDQEGHILCIYISVTSLCSPPLFNQKTGLLHSLLPCCSQNAHSLLICTTVLY